MPVNITIQKRSGNSILVGSQMWTACKEAEPTRVYTTSGKEMVLIVVGILLIDSPMKVNSLFWLRYFFMGFFVIGILLSDSLMKVNSLFWPGIFPPGLFVIVTW